MKGSSSISQKKRKRDEQSENSFVSNQRIRFDRQFPDDIIFEILSQVTFETLALCICVSKEWMNLITDQSFIELYKKKHNIIGIYSEKEWLDFIYYERFIYGKRNKKEFAGYMMQFTTFTTNESGGMHKKDPNHPTIFMSVDVKNWNPSILNWRFPNEMEILASCKQEGIVFCCDDEDNYFLGMPAVNKWMIISKPDDIDFYWKWTDEVDDHELVYGMVVLGSGPLWYKVVKLAWKRNQLYYQIYNSKIGEWQEAGVVFDSDVNLMLSTNFPAVSVSGSIYWLTNSGFVLAFNGLNDSFRIIHLFPDRDSLLNDKIYEFNGRLQLARMSCDETRLEMWEMDNNNNDIRLKKRGEVDRGTLMECEGTGWKQIDFMMEQDGTIVYMDYYDGSNRKNGVPASHGLCGLSAAGCLSSLIGMDAETFAPPGSMARW